MMHFSCLLFLIAIIDVSTVGGWVILHGNVSMVVTPMPVSYP